MVYSCYLIKHDDQYLLWDTGHSMTAPNVAPKVSIVDQLDKIGVKPEQITRTFGIRFCCDAQHSLRHAD